MNTNRDRLDESIDAVAARMTRVTEDATLASRIADALPERSRWTFSWLAPRLAITAALAIGVSLVVLRTFDDRSTDVLRTEVTSSPSATQPVTLIAPEQRTRVEPPLIVRRTIAEPSSNDRRTIDAPDFDRSLPALETASALAFDSLAPVSLPEDAPLTLKPLEIADLPLTADIFSPH